MINTITNIDRDNWNLLNEQLDKKTLLFVDDDQLAKLLYDMDIRRILAEFPDKHEKYFISGIFDTDARFIYKDIIEQNIAIPDIVLLDLSLGTLVKDTSENIVTLDGADLAAITKELHPTIDVYIATAHNLFAHGNVIDEYNNRLKEIPLDINTHYLNKNTTRYEKLKEILA